MNCYKLLLLKELTASSGAELLSYIITTKVNRLPQLFNISVEHYIGAARG